MCAAEQVWIKNWPWSTKILGQFVTHMCKNWLWYWKLSVSGDVKHILMSLIKTIMSDLKILTYIITSFTARPVRLAAILAIMSVSTLKTAIILYLLMKVHKVHVFDKNSQDQNGNINNGNKKKSLYRYVYMLRSATS